MTSGPLEGVRVVEVASYVFVPMAGAVLAEWGAEVVKVEHPGTGDPMRGLKVTGQAGSKVAPAANFHLMNRGKRSVGIDLGSPEGREVLYKLVESADVFATNLLPGTREKLQIDVPDIRRHNPQIIYVKGSGLGFSGEDHGRRGFDFATYWSRGGVAASFHSVNSAPRYPPRQVGAFGDFPAGAVLAAGVAAALAGRLATGKPSVVDVSLLSYALWQVSIGMVHALHHGADGRAGQPPDWPMILATSDDRHLALMVPGDDEGFARACADLGRPGLTEDARFADFASRAFHRAELHELLEETVRERSLQEWCDDLRDVDWVWDPVQTVEQLVADPQLIANHYVLPLAGKDAHGMRAVSSPVQFDETPPVVEEGPTEVGGATEEVLLELGYSWDELIELKISGGIL